MKNIVFSLITLLFVALVIEAGSALVLFHSGQLQGRTAARFDYSEGRLAGAVLVRKVMGRLVPSNNLEITSEPPQIYRDDPVLGYDALPGKAAFRTRLRRTGRVHVAPFTIVEGEGRATGYFPNPRQKGIWVFGDSVVFGGGNPDEHSFPWLLQARYPDWQVRNLAMSGHGNVQALLRLRQNRDRANPGDILIWGYGDYLNHRNTPSPSLVGIYSAEVFEELHPDGLKLPLAVLADGKLKIDMRRMSCEGQEDWCASGDPSYAEQARVTSALLDAFVEETRATTIVAYLEGADDDPVIEHARELGLPVIDLRPDPMRNEHDDFYPFDTHPGPISQYHYFRKISRALEDGGWLRPR